MELRALFIVLAFTNAIDAVATHEALNIGVAEMNPLMLAVLDVGGIVGVAVVKTAFLAGLAYALFYGAPALWHRITMWAVTTIYAALGIYHGVGWLMVIRIV